MIMSQMHRNLAQKAKPGASFRACMGGVLQYPLSFLILPKP